MQLKGVKSFRDSYGCLNLCCFSNYLSEVSPQLHFGLSSLHYWCIKNMPIVTVMHCVQQRPALIRLHFSAPHFYRTSNPNHSISLFFCKYWKLFVNYVTDLLCGFLMMPTSKDLSYSSLLKDLIMIVITVIFFRFVRIFSQIWLYLLFLWQWLFCSQCIS